jgi:hypothetical protein
MKDARETAVADDIDASRSARMTEPFEADRIVSVVLVSGS